MFYRRTLGRPRQADLSEFEASLVYKESSRTTKTVTQRNLALKRQTERKRERKKRRRRKKKTMKKKKKKEEEEEEKKAEQVGRQRSSMASATNHS
ncbi:hypothetical protein STEG23_027779 [Scotinomys teguina]